MAEVYVYQEYPKRLYHPGGQVLAVTSPEDEATAKADGWVTSPAEYGVETAPAAPSAQPGGYVAPGFVAPPPARAPAAEASSATDDARKAVEDLEAEAKAKREADAKARAEAESVRRPPGRSSA